MGRIVGLYKTELVRDRGPWRGLDDLELAALEWADLFNTRRLFEEHGRIPPAELEDRYYRQTVTSDAGATHTRETA